MLSPPSSLSLVALLSFLFICVSPSPSSPPVFPCNPPPQEPLAPSVWVCVRVCASPEVSQLPQRQSHALQFKLALTRFSCVGGVSPTPKTLPPPLFSNRQEWIKECIDVTPALKEKLRAIWMRRRTQWPCFGHVSLVNERDHSEQLLCRLPADLTVLQLVDIVPSAAQTIEESFGWVFTPDLAST